MSTTTSSPQTEEKTVWQELRENIWETEAWLRATFRDFLEPFGITQQQLNILRILRDAKNDPLSTKEIKALMIDKNSDVSRLVDRLIDKDLARKRQSPEDGRLIQVFIKYEGLKLLAKIDDRLPDLDDEFARLSEAEAEQLNRLLQKTHVVS